MIVTSRAMPLMSFFRIVLVLLSCAAAGPVFAQDGPAHVEIVDAWARVALTSTETSAYVSIVNRGGEDDHLISVSSPVAAAAELQKIGGWGFTMKPKVVENLKIPAASVVKLKPGRTFIHVTGLTEKLEPGRSLPLALRFEKTGTLYVDAEISNQELGNRGR